MPATLEACFNEQNALTENTSLEIGVPSVPMSSRLDLSSLEKAVASLAEALRESQAEPEKKLLRDGCIQRFEYTYELCHKMLKRYLEMTEPNPENIDLMSFQTLIRTGFERGLLRHSWEAWRDYRNKRGTTSHTYDEEKAKDVYTALPSFLSEAEFLLAQLRQRTIKP